MSHDISEALVLAAGQVRRAGRLDLPDGLPAADPPLDAVAAAVAGSAAHRTWLAGGEPTLRSDLPRLLRACRPTAGELGLCTDGLALAGAGVAAQLRALGLQRVRIPFHAARTDAHDWLVDQPGAAKRVARALRAAVAAGLAVEAEVVVTRPTVDHLPETVSALARLGVQRVLLRRVVARGPAAALEVTLAPRLGLAQPLLEKAVRTARREGLDAAVQGFPRCALGGESDAWVTDPAVLAPVPALEPVALSLRGPEGLAGCADCPGAPRCGGAPADYVARFGRTEIDDRCSLAPRDGFDPGTGEGPPGTPPPPRYGREPATRLAFAARQAARGDLRGDPMAGVRGVRRPEVVRAVFPPDSSTRPLRKELCRLAQVGASTLRIDDPDSLLHPQVGELLRECVRLGFARVELRGPVHGLLGLSDRELIGLRGLTRFEALVPSDEQAQAADLLDRLQRLARCEIELVST